VKEKREPRDERNQRRLVGEPPGKMLEADEKIQLILVETVAREGEKMRRQRDERDGEDAARRL
jgi:hypothetical protein